MRGQTGTALLEHFLREYAHSLGPLAVPCDDCLDACSALAYAFADRSTDCDIGAAKRELRCWSISFGNTPTRWALWLCLCGDHSLTQLVYIIFTMATQACFEPSLDWVVVKLSKWDMRKFKLDTAPIPTSAARSAAS